MEEQTESVPESNVDIIEQQAQTKIIINLCLNIKEQNLKTNNKQVSSFAHQYCRGLMSVLEN